MKIVLSIVCHHFKAIGMPLPFAPLDIVPVLLHSNYKVQ